MTRTPSSLLKNSTGCVIAWMRCQNGDEIGILRAVRSFAPHLARLKNATMAFFNGLERTPSNTIGGNASCLVANGVQFANCSLLRRNDA